jgi:hypothetical protein
MLGRLPMPRVLATLTLITAIAAAILPTGFAWSQTMPSATVPNPAPDAPPPPAEAPPPAPVNPAPIEVAPPAVAPAPPATAPIVKKKAHIVHPQGTEAQFEPASGRLKVIKETYVYSEPSRVSRKLEKAEASKYVNVTGTTRYYVRVKLKDGRTGYVPNAAVELVKPFQKDFLLTADAPVYAEPNHWSKRVSEVHKGRNVHVIAVTPGYIKIRMKSGLEGYVPQSAVE